MIKNIICFLVLVVAATITGCGDKNLSRSDKPLTRSDFMRCNATPLPLSARNIYYLYYAGGMQNLEFFLRFDLDKEDIEGFVNAQIARNNQEFKRTLEYPVEKILASDSPLVRPEFLPMPWWNPQDIKSGYFRGHKTSYALRIFVDTENSRIYLYQND